MRIVLVCVSCALETARTDPRARRSTVRDMAKGDRTPPATTCVCVVSMLEDTKRERVHLCCLMLFASKTHARTPSQILLQHHKSSDIRCRLRSPKWILCLSPSKVAPLDSCRVLGAILYAVRWVAML